MGTDNKFSIVFVTPTPDRIFNEDTIHTSLIPGHIQTYYIRNHHELIIGGNYDTDK